MAKVIIIGAGASGLTAAIIASKNNNEVIILEKNSEPGKKILSTGNGRCNYWNKDQDISHYHSNNEELLNKYITEENKNKVMDFFNNIGIIPKIKNGYYYPNSNQAISVRNALLNECKNKKVNIKCNIDIREINLNNDIYEIKTNEGIFYSDYLVISTGSKAGINQDSYNNIMPLLKKFSHKQNYILPSLVQLIGEGDYFKYWDGVRSDVEISLYENNKFIKKEIGEIQLTKYGISGICSMQLSGLISKGLNLKKQEKVKINFLNNICGTKEELIELLNNLDSKMNSNSIDGLLNGILNNKLINLILIKTNSQKKKWSEITTNEKEVIAELITSFSLNIIATKDFSNAQVVTGGVPLTDVTANFESIYQKRLYFTGEILDVDGDCGGYNLGFAWMSGIIVGSDIHD